MDYSTSFTQIITTVTIINSTNKRFTGPTTDIIPTHTIIGGVINKKVSTSVITIARAAFILDLPVITDALTPTSGHTCMEDSGQRSSLVIAIKPSYRNVRNLQPETAR